MEKIGALVAFAEHPGKTFFHCIEHHEQQAHSEMGQQQ